MATFFGGAIELLRKFLIVTQGNSSGAPLVVCALDLLAALCTINGEEFWGLALQTGVNGSPSLLQLVETCSMHPQVRPSACALLGEVAKVIKSLKLWRERFGSLVSLLVIKKCGQHLGSSIAAVIPLLIHNLEMVPPPVCNNASWAIGELVMHIGPTQLQPFIEPIMSRLISLVNRSLNSSSLVRSCSLGKSKVL
jgi:hypothetical protein